jgi:hypothetical protein
MLAFSTSVSRLTIVASPEKPTHATPPSGGTIHGFTAGIVPMSMTGLITIQKQNIDPIPTHASSL